MFITLEGGEGSGKSTLIQALKEYFLSQGEEVLITREPGGSSLGAEIRRLLLEKRATGVDPMAELLLFLAERAQHVSELILPALKSGKVVLCDRFSDSTIAYQGHARGLGVEKTTQLCRIAEQGATPTLTFLLDIDPQEGLRRASKTTKAEKDDRMEAELLEFHEKVRAGFLDLSTQFKDRIHIIDASQSKEAVFNEAKRIITDVQQAH